ncbi:hypothetical protein VTI74DRAFT_203 [Chaetomium olivicolor]
MAHSSPGQSRPFVSMDQLPGTGSLEDTAGDFSHDDSGPAEVPCKQPEPFPAIHPSPEKSPHGEASTPQGEAVGYRTPEESLLLDRPSIVSKPPDLEKCYEYGPAVQLAPDQFTKMPVKQASIYHDERPSPSKVESSPRAVRDVSGSAPRFPSLGGTKLRNTINGAVLSVDPLQRGSTQSTTQSHGMENNNAGFHGTSEARKMPPMLGKPPFPDSPSTEQPVPVQSRPVQVADTSRTTLGEGKTKAHTLLKSHPDVTEFPLRQGHHASLPVANDGDRNAIHHYEPSTHGQQPSGNQEKQDHKISTESSRHPLDDFADRARLQTVNRPVDDMANARPVRAVHRHRPDSRSSHVSKQRSRCGSLASSPMVRQRRVNINHEFTTGIAGVINQFTQQQNAALEEQRTKYHKYIKRLKRELEEASGITACQVSQLNAQAGKIKEIEASREHMANQLQDLETKLGASEDRSRRLEEKYHACKKHLNSAIQEQQDLYLRSKKQWGEVIEQVKAMEKAQSAETEMIVQKAEVIREQMIEKVRQVIAQNRSEASKLYGKIDVLTKEAEEKETELNRERESVRVLSEKLQALQATSSGFEALAAQGKEILDKFEVQRAKTEEQHHNFAQELRDRLETIANRLEALSNVTSSQPDTLTTIQKAQQESLRIVTSKLDSLLKSRDSTTKAAAQLTTDLELHIGKIWQRLDNQLESVGKQLAEKAEENGMISTLYKRKEAECDKHIQDLADLQETTQKQAQQIIELEGELFALGTAQDENEETIRRLEASATENIQLKEDIEAKAVAISELQRKLDAREKTYAAELEKYSSRLFTLTQSIQAKDQSTIDAQKAVEVARREARAEMESSRVETENVLRETQRHRDLLVGQVEILKQQVQEKEQNEVKHAATISSLQQSLSAAETKGQMVEQELAQSSANLQRVASGLNSRISDLETELRAAKENAVELEEESQRQQERSEALISGLKQWALQEGLDIGGLGSFSDGNKSAGEIKASLVRALGQMFISQRLKPVTPEGHSGGISLTGENSKFLSPESGQRSQEDLEAKTGSSQSADGDVHVSLVEVPETLQNSMENVYGGNDPLPYAVTLHHMRRVVVRSPANVPNEPVAPSIDQEKARRREALQPKSIMKRVTRSTSGLSKQKKSNGAAGHGAFKRNTRDEPGDAFTAEELAGALGNNDVVPGSNVSATGDTFLRPPSKRRRSNSMKSDASAGHVGNSKSRKTEASPSLKQKESNSVVSITVQQKELRSCQEKRPGAAQPRNIKSEGARNPRRCSGADSGELHRTPSVNTSQVLEPRQHKVRTYGSQRTVGEASKAASHPDNRSSLRSQSHSRYWSSPNQATEGSQDSITFSQGGGGDESLPLPFRN